MHFDMGKRLMDCTLGEYLAAERAVGITTQWGAALLIAVASFALARFYARWKTRRATRAEQAYRRMPRAEIPTYPPGSKIARNVAGGVMTDNLERRDLYHVEQWDHPFNAECGAQIPAGTAFYVGPWRAPDLCPACAAEYARRVYPYAMEEKS